MVEEEGRRVIRKTMKDDDDSKRERENCDVKFRMSFKVINVFCFCIFFGGFVLCI